MLTLLNFGKQINAAILERGQEYYENGSVISLEETDNNNWTAEVEGSETYTVEVTLNKRYEISDYSCDCPYDNVTCKHVIAVLYSLLDEIKMTKLQPGKLLKKQVFDNLLKSLTIKEYQDFTRNYAAGNKDFKTSFELFFADKDGRINVQEKYAELIQKIIRKYARNGYIDYSSSVSLSKEVNRLIKTGAGYISKNNFRDALALIKAILRPLMEVMSNCDDSSGNIGDCIDNVIRILETIATADAAAIDIKDQAFAFLQAELNNKDYFNYGDFGDYLFEIFKDLAIQLGKSGMLLEYIDSWLSKLTGQYDYDLKEMFQREKIATLQQSGKVVEAEKALLQNLDIVSLRSDVVNKAIEKKDFAKAKKMIAEGIKIADGRKHPGTVTLWQKELLRIAMLEKDTKTVRQYAKHFAFDAGFSAEYYKQWKTTFSKAEWRGEIEKYIAEAIKKISKEWGSKRNQYWRPANPPLLQCLAPVFIQESFTDRLLALVQQANALTTTIEYHPYLLKEYPDELLALYLSVLEMYGIESDSREKYSHLVKQMKRVIKDIPVGKEKILGIAERLKERFSHKPYRPAMIEELNKILK